MLLGAGASKFAGIPTTKDLVAELRKRVASLGDQRESPAAEFFASNLLIETSPKDIEDLYELIDRMVDAEKVHRIVTKCKTKEQGDDVQFVPVSSSSAVPEGESERPRGEIDDIDDTIKTLKSIKSVIRDMLLERCMVDPKRRDDVKIVFGSVLEPLAIRNVLTTNYDNVIETYCEEARTPLANGFEPSFHGDRREWTGKFGKAESGALRLVKMHGSVTWQRDGDAVLEIGRLSARDEEYDVMIYPEKGTKRYDKSIFPRLRRKFSEVLANTDLLVVIGFSFRDEEINRMIRQRLAVSDQRGKMRLLYLDPEPNSGLSSLMDRVVSLQTVHTSMFTLQVYSTDAMPYVCAYEMEFGSETRQFVKFAADAVSEIYE